MHILMQLWLDIYFVQVCGCPKTIDGDLKVLPYIPTSFGFDTACRLVFYSALL